MKQLRSIITLLILAAAVYVGFQVVPVYYNNFAYQDFVDNQVRIDCYTNRSADEVATTMLKKANNMGIPLTPEDIKVTRGAASLSVSIKYAVHIDLPFHPIDLTFNPAATENRM